MIDLETTATTPKAGILSIGACYFNPSTGEIGDKFHEKIRWKDAFRRQVDTDTIEWWMKQSDDARNSVIGGTQRQSVVLKKFRDFIGDKNPYVWGNGATFDISILEHAYKYDVPWKFWNIRDMRTITHLSKLTKLELPKREGTHHSALDDAIYQAMCVSTFWRKILRK